MFAISVVVVCRLELVISNFLPSQLGVISVTVAVQVKTLNMSVISVAIARKIALLIPALRILISVAAACRFVTSILHYLCRLELGIQHFCPVPLHVSVISVAVAAQVGTLFMSVVSVCSCKLTCRIFGIFCQF